MLVLLRIIITVLAVGYPLLVYFGLRVTGASAFGIVLAGVLSLRLITSLQTLDKKHCALYLLLIVYSLAISVVNSEGLLRFYPVIINLALGSLFILSVLTNKPLITETLIKLKQPVPAEAITYLYWLTFLWGLLLIANAGVAAYTACCMSLAQWTLYNGVLSYLIFAVFFLLECVFRLWFKHRKKFETPQI